MNQRNDVFMWHCVDKVHSVLKQNVLTDFDFGYRLIF